MSSGGRQHARTVDVDLLVIGGGIQGLALVRQYTEERRGSVVLVSRDALGKGETLHSHGYLHSGYSLPLDRASSIGDFKESFDWWDGWMRRNGLHYEDGASILFDIPEERYEATTRAWDAAGLRFDPVARLPEALQGGIYSRPDHGRRLVRIHDRLIPAWKIVETMSEPLQDVLVRGEATSMSWDPGTNRIADCVVATSEGTLRFRPGCLVLATGRDTQVLLKKITGPDGVCPLTDELRAVSNIRDVPMILLKGASLPAISGWFFCGGPIAIMSHPPRNGERMWVVTPMEGHRTSREDFEERTRAVGEATIRKTLHALADMIPEWKSLSAETRISTYVGPKTDHPQGVPTWYIGDAGIENLRFVWPVLWGLAHGAGRELIRGLPEPALPGKITGLPTGVEIGEEYRLSASRSWRTL